MYLLNIRGKQFYSSVLHRYQHDHTIGSGDQNRRRLSLAHDPLCSVYVYKQTKETETHLLQQVVNHNQEENKYSTIKSFRLLIIIKKNKIMCHLYLIQKQI